MFLGAGVGAGLAFFINDRVGRLWSFRLYVTLWIVGQMIAVSAPSLAALYASRIVSGLGMGALTTIGPMAIAEIAPPEIRGLLTAWFNVAMGFASTSGAFCVLGVYEHVRPSRFQYQVVWFSPCIFLAVCLASSFFLCESPRWLFLVNRPEEASQTLAKLRGLPLQHLRVQQELAEIQNAIQIERNKHDDGIVGILKETFLVPANLRRVQQSLLTYALAQLSGANAITSYFVPVLTIIGVGGGTARNMFLSAMVCSQRLTWAKTDFKEYTFAKMWFAIITSFFFIDALGRRRSLFIGTTLQMISDIYLGVYVKFRQQGSVSQSASSGAIAFIFIHGFGYTTGKALQIPVVTVLTFEGLYILPYVFGAELWPNRIRSFGSALSQCFHWLFIFAMAYASPSLLAQTHNWGAFLFFAGWCLTAAIYVYFMVPEVAGLTVEEIDHLFAGSWFNAHKRAKRLVAVDAVEESSKASAAEQ